MLQENFRDFLNLWKATKDKEPEVIHGVMKAYFIA
jgi:hypothetical protein